MSCIHMDENKCKILTDKKCTACRFRTTEEQAAAKKAKHDARLNSLPEDLQDRIADAYYMGKKTWQE